MGGGIEKKAVLVEHFTVLRAALLLADDVGGLGGGDEDTGEGVMVETGGGGW